MFKNHTKQLAAHALLLYAMHALHQGQIYATLFSTTCVYTLLPPPFRQPVHHVAT